MTTAQGRAANSARAFASADEDNVGAGLIGAAVAVVAWGSASILAKVITLDGIVLGAYRFTLYGLAMLLFLRIRRAPFSWRALKASAAGGIALGLDIALFFSAVKLTTIVDATVIGSLQPVVLMVVASRFFGEKITLRDVTLAGVAIAGVIVVVTSSAGAPEWSLEGDLLALGAVFAWAAYFVFSKQSKGKITSAEYTTGTAIWSALISFPLALGFGQDLSWPSWHDWLWLLVMTAVAGILGHSLMNWSLVRIPLWVGSTLTLLIPVASSLLAWIVLGEALTVVQMLAMGLVIGCLAAIVKDQADRRTVETTVAG